mmetsp:Transcript_12844/g.29292  ORF Transcript_12844/g.29292 Transcript_12844/m.29292 type:complete len:241 (+) Transcript_12844:371-1093(+)
MLDLAEQQRPWLHALKGRTARTDVSFVLEDADLLRCVPGEQHFPGRREQRARGEERHVQEEHGVAQRDAPRRGGQGHDCRAARVGTLLVLQDRRGQAAAGANEAERQLQGRLDRAQDARRVGQARADHRAVRPPGLAQGRMQKLNVHGHRARTSQQHSACGLRGLRGSRLRSSRRHAVPVLSKDHMPVRRMPAHHHMQLLLWQPERCHCRGRASDRRGRLIGAATPLCTAWPVSSAHAVP